MLSTIKDAIKRWRILGAIAPSSKYLVNNMLDKIVYTKDIEVLQLGFGTGVFTKQLLENLTPNSKLIIFEVNKGCREYKISDDRIHYIEDSAEYVSRYFEGKQFDHIVSTLPFATIPDSIGHKIQEQIKIHLKPGGKYLQYQYSLYSRNDISKLFGTKPRIEFVLMNLPPAFIYETGYFL